MRRYKVESSNIDSIGHNFLTKNLEIEFKDGNIYRYKKVPRGVFKNMMNADSKGKFFWKNVRFEYPYKKHRTKDGDKVRDEWKKLERKEKKDMEGQEKVAMSNVAKGAIVGGVVGATGGVVRGAGNALLNERIPKKKKLKEALKAAVKQGLVGGAAGTATGAVSPAMWNALNEKPEKKASETLDSMYKEAALTQAQKAKLLESMIGAGAGSLVGAGAGTIRAKHISKKKGETKEEARRRMRNNVLGGALVGASIGGAGSVIANKAARNRAKESVPFYNDSDIAKHREDFLDKYRKNRERSYAMMDGHDHFDSTGRAVRRGDINMFMNWSPESPDVAKANAVRSSIGRMERIKDRLENETGVDFVNRLRDKKSYGTGIPPVEGVTHKNGKPIIGGHFDNDDFVNFVEKSSRKGEFDANHDLINNRLFGGFRGRDTDAARKYIIDAGVATRDAAKKDILADVAAIKAQTRVQYQKDKAKNAKKAERMIYHYSNLADKLEGGR